MRTVTSLGMMLMLCAPTSFADTGKFNINGTWVGVAPDGSIIKYTFTRDKKFLWNINEKGFLKIFPKGLKGKYKITQTKKISTIDITDLKHPMFKGTTYLGIYQVIDAKNMKFQGLPSTAGPRLTKFSKHAIVFKRVK